MFLCFLCVCVFGCKTTQNPGESDRDVPGDAALPSVPGHLRDQPLSDGVRQARGVRAGRLGREGAVEDVNPCGRPRVHQGLQHPGEGDALQGTSVDNMMVHGSRRDLNQSMCPAGLHVSEYLLFCRKVLVLVRREKVGKKYENLTKHTYTYTVYMSQVYFYLYKHIRVGRVPV